MFQVNGILKVKNDEVRVSDRFRKREFVLTIEPGSQYPQHVQFQLAQDKCALLDGFNIGEEIKINFNLRGREWVKDNETRYFNTLDVWKIERAGNSNAAPQQNQNSYSNSNSNSMDSGNSAIFSGAGSDDLPF